MLTTAIKPKNVSFQLPGSTQRSSTAPATTGARNTIKSPPVSTLREKPATPPILSIKPTVTRISSPQPDLIQDILDQPVKLKPNKEMWASKESETAKKKIVGEEKTLAGAAKEKVTGEELKVSKVREEKPVSSSQTSKPVKSKWTKTHRPSIATSPKRLSQIGLVTKMTNDVRELSNMACLDHARWMKHDMAKLREHVIKVDEEIKLGNKAKATLDAKIFDLRKCLSVNQQSISAQQKKSHKEDGLLKRLREETHVLSKSKRRLEQHLVQMKSHLWNLDSMRKTIKSKAANLSRALELDAQRLRVYSGPVVTEPERVSKMRHYTNACPLPQNTVGDEAVAHLCGTVLEMIAASKALRNDMKSMIQSIYASKAEAHHRITFGLAKSVVETKAHQTDLVLKQGRTRMEQNTIAHQRHIGEIALGVALGPHSENYRSASEKVDRPLSRLRPASAIVESQACKDIATNIKRQLSASAVKASRVSTSHSKLKRKIRSDSFNTEIDLRVMLTRKASLDKH